jgi:hypothetical protein
MLTVVDSFRRGMSPGTHIFVGICACAVGVIWWFIDVTSPSIKYRGWGQRLLGFVPWWLLAFGIGLCVVGILMPATPH